MSNFSHGRDWKLSRLPCFICRFRKQEKEATLWQLNSKKGGHYSVESSMH